MNTQLFAILINSIVTLAGVFGGILTANKLSNYRIEQLEKKVEKHNNTIERTYKLEQGLADFISETNSNLTDIKADLARLKDKVVAKSQVQQKKENRHYCTLCISLKHFQTLIAQGIAESALGCKIGNRVTA